MKRAEHLVLGVESSCDDSSVAILEEGRTLRAHLIASQDIHRLYGGVVPELAARAHLEFLPRLARQALEEARVDASEITGVAVTRAPGLVGSLVVGVAFAKALGLALGVPVTGVNHIEAHLHAGTLEHGDSPLPALALVVSGGHTELVEVQGFRRYRWLGSTRDDAVGEAFDKVAKMLGLPYPGGPEVERAASGGNAQRFAFPRPMLGRVDANFSLSGLKTAVRNEVSLLTPLEERDIRDLCASFQAAVLESTADRLSVGLRLFHERFGPPRALVAAGGVAANQAIRGALQDVAARAQTTLIIPPPALCTDNGAMIAWAGAERLALGLTDTMDAAPRARWLLDQNARPPAKFANTRAGF